MKTSFCLLLALLPVLPAGADPDRYPTRAVGLVNADLQPLFAWWTFASQTTNQPLDITLVDTNKLEVISNLWLHLPPRPLLDWFDVKASEGNIAVAGTMWKMDALISPAPMMTKRQMIYLRNPPVKEIQDFKLARAAYAALQGAQGNEVAAEQMWESNIQAEASAMLETNSVPSAVPSSQSAIAQARNLQQDSIMTLSNINSSYARTKARDRQMMTAETYLAAFPDKDVYWLDHFALRTGETVDGLDVYDLGTAPYLTY